MQDSDFPEGQRNRAQRRAYVDFAVARMFKQIDAGPSVEVEALLDRYVAGEILLQQVITALGRQHTA